MSTSTVFTLPSSVEIARLVTPLKLASHRFVRWTVSIHTLGPVSVTRTRVAPPPYSVTFPSTVESVLQTVESTRVKDPPDRILTYARLFPSEPWSTYSPPVEIVTWPETSRHVATETSPTICRSNDHVVTPVGQTWRLSNEIVSAWLLSASLTAG